MTNPNNDRFANSDPAYEVGLQRVEKLAREKGSILRIVNERGRRMSVNEPEEFAIISTLALQLERRDRENYLYEDPYMQTSKAAILGAMTGLLVAEASIDGEISTNEILAAIDIKDAIESGDESERRAVNDAVIDISGAALQQMEAAEELISRWEGACVTDFSYYHYYRIGFGLVVGSASKAIHDKHLDDLRQRLEVGEIDWDQAFMDMGRFES